MKEDIENFYQFQDLHTFEEGTNLRMLKCKIDDSRIKVSKYIETQYWFDVPTKCIENLYNEDGDPILFAIGDILFSKGDNSYFEVIDMSLDGKTMCCVPYENARLFWNKSVFLNPGSLNYWFDFLDTEGELNQFSVRAIGSRTKAINENTIKSIYFRDVPQVIFQEKAEWSSPQMSGYKYIQIPDLDKMFTISAQGKSAKERLDELLYAHGYCSESASITAIPIYYLQPNVRVNISDAKTNLSGDYIVSKITIPLSHNGTMSLTTTKAAQTIFL